MVGEDVRPGHEAAGRRGGGPTGTSPDRPPAAGRKKTGARSTRSGILVVDKPAGISSAGVVARVKRMLGAVKVGHTGTLDPFARGVLVCCINQATKLAQFLLHEPKTYLAELTLGIDTDTQDATGRVVAQRRWQGVTQEALEGLLPRFSGRISQQPPVYSALKHEGTPLYAHARAGRPVHKPPRPVTVYHLRVVEMALPRACFEVRCSAGTYVRTLGADMGEALGCGGHLSGLTRTESGGFRLEQALSLEALEALSLPGAAGAPLIPMARALPGVPELVAEAPLIERIRHGRRLGRHDFGEPGGGLAGEAAGLVKVLDAQGDLAAVLRAAPDAEELQYCAVFEKSSPEMA
jgi:tRNA pseudouridine55 synthase